MRRFSGARNRPLSLCGPLFPTHGSLLIFLFHKSLKSIRIRTLRQFWLLPFAEPKKHFKQKPFTLQQDGAPSHTSNKTQEWCKTHFTHFWSKEVWTSSWPDLNPMNFCAWFILEADACTSAHDSVEALEGSLKKARDKIPQDTLRRAVDSFRCWFESIIEARGRHIE